jgi:hypothetical protein
VRDEDTPRSCRRDTPRAASGLVRVTHTPSSLTAHDLRKVRISPSVLAHGRPRSLRVRVWAGCAASCAATGGGGAVPYRTVLVSAAAGKAGAAVSSSRLVRLVPASAPSPCSSRADAGCSMATAVSPSGALPRRGGTAWAQRGRGQRWRKGALVPPALGLLLMVVACVRLWRSAVRQWADLARRGEATGALVRLRAGLRNGHAPRQRHHRRSRRPRRALRGRVSHICALVTRRGSARAPWIGSRP